MRHSRNMRTAAAAEVIRNRYCIRDMRRPIKPAIAWRADAARTPRWAARRQLTKPRTLRPASPRTSLDHRATTERSMLTLIAKCRCDSAQLFAKPQVDRPRIGTVAVPFEFLPDNIAPHFTFAARDFCRDSLSKKSSPAKLVLGKPPHPAWIFARIRGPVATVLATLSVRLSRKGPRGDANLKLRQR